MSNPWNAPVSSCGRRGGLGGVTVRVADLSAQRRLVYRLLSDGKPRSSADIAAELHLCDPRAIIRDLRNAGFPIGDEWVKGERCRFKRYFIRKGGVR